jgi:HD-like signal output (HDOD) protein
MSLEYAVLALVALVLLLGAIALWLITGRRRRAGVDPSTQLAALRAASAAALGMASPLSAVPVQDVPHADAEQAAAARAATLRALQQLALGQKAALEAAAPAISSTAPDEKIRQAILARLEHIVEQPHYAPRRPMLLPKLMQAVSDDSVSQRELVRILAGDPALAGNLLRLANSSFYRHNPEPVESLDRAVAILGIDGMRSMIAAALMQPIFRIDSKEFAAFGEITWEHSLYAGHAAEAHAAIVENSDPFAAQLLALLMGLATIVVFRVVQDEYLARQRAPTAAAVAALIDAQWVPVARQIASNWTLSERMDEALAQQLASSAAPASALARSLQFGRNLGALAVLFERGAIDASAAQAALRLGSGTPNAQPGTTAAERIWARLAIKPG